MTSTKNNTVTINGKNFVVISPAKSAVNNADNGKCGSNVKLRSSISNSESSKKVSSERPIVPKSEVSAVAGSSKSSTTTSVVKRPLIKIVPRCLGVSAPTTAVVKIEPQSLTSISPNTSTVTSKLTPIAPTTTVVKIEPLEARVSQALTSTSPNTSTVSSHQTPIVSRVRPASVFLLATSAGTTNSSLTTPSISSHSQNSKRKVGYWTNEQVRELIAIYRNFPCLYEMGSDDYLDKFKKREAWQYVTKFITHSRPNTTEDEVKAKWNALRTNYSAELGKLEKSLRNGANPNKVFVSSMTFFNDIDFLRPYMSIRKGSSNVRRLEVKARRRKSEEIEEPESDEITTIYDAVDAVLNSEEEGYSEPCPIVPEVSLDPEVSPEVEPEEEILPEVKPEIKRETRKRKRLRTDPGAKQFLREAGSLLSKIQSLQEATLEQKPFDGFSSFIGETLRALPDEKAQRLRNEIMQTILNFS